MALYSMLDYMCVCVCGVEWSGAVGESQCGGAVGELEWGGAVGELE